MQLNLKVGEIVRIVGGQTSLDPSFLIENISSFENAGQNDLAFFIERGESSVFDPFNIDVVKNSKAGLILATKSVIEGKNYLLVNDSLKAFQILTDFIQNKNISSGIHSSAIVSQKENLQRGVTVGAGAVVQVGATIGEYSYIGAQAFIGRNVCIGNNVKIYPGARVLDGCVIGDNSIIHAGVIIGSDGFGYEVGKLGLRKIPQIGNVKIGKDVEIGANSCIDRAAFDQTLICDGVKIDNMVHIAHNVRIGNCTAILAQTVIGGTVQIGVGCQIGGHVAIKDHVKIGNNVKIVSKSAIMNDIKDGQVVAGQPAVSFLQWKKIMVATKRLPEILGLANKLNSFLNSEKKKPSFWSRFF